MISKKIQNLFPIGIILTNLYPIFGIVFLQWDVFLIMFLILFEFFILGVFSILDMIRILFKSLLKEHARNKKGHEFTTILSDGIAAIALSTFVHGIIIFLYGSFVAIFFVKGFPQTSDGFAFLSVLKNLFVDATLSVWPAVAIILTNNLYGLIFLKKEYIGKIGREYNFKIFVFHFIVVFIGSIIRFVPGFQKILLIIIILLKTSTELSSYYKIE